MNNKSAPERNTVWSLLHHLQRHQELAHEGPRQEGSAKEVPLLKQPTHRWSCSWHSTWFCCRGVSSNFSLFRFCNDTFLQIIWLIIICCCQSIKIIFFIISHNYWYYCRHCSYITIIYGWQPAAKMLCVVLNNLFQLFLRYVNQVCLSITNSAFDNVDNINNKYWRQLQLEIESVTYFNRSNILQCPQLHLWLM